MLRDSRGAVYPIWGCMMTIRGKLFSSLAALALSITGLAATSYIVSSNSESALSTVLNDRVVPLEDLKIVADEYAVGIVDAAHKARNGNVPLSEAAGNVRGASKKISDHWGKYRATKIVGEEEQIATKVEQDRVAADRAVADLQLILDRGDRAALDQFVVNRLYPAVDPVSGSIAKLVGLQIEIARSDTNGALTSAANGLLIIILLVLAAFVVAGASLFIIAKKVVEPIRRLSQTIHGLARENSEAEVPHREQKDEIGDIARAVDAFRTSVVEKERLRANEAAAVQERVTSSLAEGLSALAGGDLTYQVKIAFPAEYERLKTDFNAAVMELRTAMKSISHSTGNIHGGSGEISQASDDLSRRTEQQAASLEETAAAMTEITATVQNNSSGANEAAKLVRQTQAEAQESEKVVGAAVSAMTEIEKSSQEVNKIISVIEKIAFQTNLLALNASVEAAHAGEAGKAFAVVANEVRALAQRAADAAQEIGQLISNSTGQVQNGVGLVNDAGKALQRIIGQVHEIHSHVTQIAAASEQQSSALAQVNTAINEMDKVTQQNAAMVEESTAAARSLSDESSDLAHLVSRFAIGQQGSAASVVKMPKKSAPAPKPAVRGNTALAMQTQLNEAVEDWNEF